MRIKMTPLFNKIKLQMPHLKPKELHNVIMSGTRSSFPIRWVKLWNSSYNPRDIDSVTSSEDSSTSLADSEENDLESDGSSERIDTSKRATVNKQGENKKVATACAAGSL